MPARPEIRAFLSLRMFVLSVVILGDFQPRSQGFSLYFRCGFTVLHLKAKVRSACSILKDSPYFFRQ